MYYLVIITLDIIYYAFLQNLMLPVLVKYYLFLDVWSLGVEISMVEQRKRNENVWAKSSFIRQFFRVLRS